MAMPEPCEANDFLFAHAELLIRSFKHWTGRDLIDPALSSSDTARALYCAPFVVLSHDTAADPLFTYANETAQRLFEIPWVDIVGMPSRHSAETVAQAERASFLDQVATHGYIENYTGVRVARSGRRFRVSNATVWNLLDNEACYCGQAACFSEWEPIGVPSP